MAHILIIDDNENVRIMLQFQLENKGHIVQTTTNGGEGIQYNKIVNFDVIITDIFVPEKDGLDSVTEIRKINPRVKIIAISDGGELNSTVGYLEISEKMGVDYTMNKPIDDKKLLTIIDLLISEKLELNEEDND